ncbi:chaperonin 10-like protein [Lineolata rhizophorae]|uniref:Chaperonin 10-like protein n=1 Tax=Lineolata rhizophorae TaxID=578093 RepID=A0A6A6P5D2_9PEZI|nr:chaperonin 10-like protein [Lineolata rhizophorae]
MASANVPQTMKCVCIEQTGGPEVLQLKEMPVPTPKEGEVLIKNEFVGVNFIDIYFRTGLYPTPSFPSILGRECAGTIAALGPTTSTTTSLRVGDRVAALTGGGAYAEYAVAPVRNTAPVPPGLSTDNAAAALLQGLTALAMTRESHRVEKGDYVLVHAAAGGVGLWLLRVLRALGARIVATAGGEAKCRLVRETAGEALVAVVDYKKEGGYAEVEKVVKENTPGGEGVICVLDGVGKDTFDLSLGCLRRKGTMVSFGNASGAVPPLTITRLSPKCLKLVRPQLYPYIATQDEFEGYVVQLFDMMLKNKINTNMHEIYPLAEAARAQVDLGGRKTTGKLLLKV